jgi:GNAT superfamily N-acetyltransferase
VWRGRWRRAGASGIQTSLRYPTTWVVGNYAAAAVWIPPGGSVVPAEQEAEYERLMSELVRPRTAEVMELDECFEAIYPHDRPHYYLPLLGTHPDHRCRGLGMGLLAHNLAQFDAEGVAAYLESTNPDNDRRYERLAFVKVGGSRLPTAGTQHPQCSNSAVCAGLHGISMRVLGRADWFKSGQGAGSVRGCVGIASDCLWERAVPSSSVGAGLRPGQGWPSFHDMKRSSTPASLAT